MGGERLATDKWQLGYTRWKAPPHRVSSCHKWEGRVAEADYGIEVDPGGETNEAQQVLSP